MSITARKIDFLESRSRPDMKSGAPLALTDCIFSVDGVEVIVCVHHTAKMTLGGASLSPDDVALAARTFLEIEIEKNGEMPPGYELVLNETAMQLIVAPQLGWIDRFLRRDLSSPVAPATGIQRQGPLGWTGKEG